MKRHGVYILHKQGDLSPQNQPKEKRKKKGIQLIGENEIICIWLFDRTEKQKSKFDTDCELCHHIKLHIWLNLHHIYPQCEIKVWLEEHPASCESEICVSMYISVKGRRNTSQYLENFF